MNILDFADKFKDENACKEFYRDIRMKEGVICKHCRGTKHYWLATKWQASVVSVLLEPLSEAVQ